MTDTYFVDNRQVYSNVISAIKARSILALDTETTGLDPYTSELLLIQIGNGSHQYVLDYQSLKRAGETFDDLKDILTSKEYIKVLHNAKFDYKMIKVHLGVPIEHMVCTFVLEHTLKKGIRQKGFSLLDLAHRYLNIDLDKGIRQTFLDHRLSDSFTAEQIMYSALDIKYLIQIYKLQSELIKRLNMQDLATLECMVIAPTADMELNGVYVDDRKWLGLYADSDKMRAAAEKELMDIFQNSGTIDKYKAWAREEKVLKTTDAYQKKQAKNQATNQSTLEFFSELADIRSYIDKTIPDASTFPVNLASPVQMAKLLSIFLDKEITTTVEEQLKKISNDPIIDKVIALRKFTKLCTTYGEEFLNKAVHPVTKRIHTNFNQVKADSGRYSSSDPVNLQNIPNDAKYRAAFCVQDPSWKMIATDFSGAELRIMAEICQEEAWIKAFKEGYDLHSFIASMLYKIPYEEMTENHHVKPKYKELRGVAKSLVFGISYGMGAGRLANNLKIEIKEARILLDKFWGSFPAIKDGLDKYASEALAKGYAFSPLDNRRRYLRSFDFDVKGERIHAENIAKNMICQGACASIMKQALVNLREASIDKGWYDKKFRLLMTIHDEAVLEVHESIADEAVALVDKLMVEAAEKYVKTVPMIAETAIGNHWIH